MSTSMDYVGNIIRPPSEAESIILQVTVGCSYNKCTFCGAYKGTLFTKKPVATVNADIAFAKKHCLRQKRVFLADGDVLILKQNHLVTLFNTIRKELPWVKRISLYGSGRAITLKTLDQLLELKALGLDRIYMGLESGCDDTLKKVKKGETAESMIVAGSKVKESGIFLSVTALLGLAGTKLSKQHAILTASALNRMNPNQIAVLTLMILDNTPLGEDERSGVFEMIGPGLILEELHTLVSHLNVKRSQFYANHASNYLPLAGRLSKDKNRILAEIVLAIAGRKQLIAENLRAL